MAQHRSASGWITGRPGFGLVVLALVVLSLLPSGWIGWAGYLNSPLVFLFAPVQRPLRSLVVWLKPPEPARGPDDPMITSLQSERDDYWRRLLQAQQEVVDLRTLIKDLSRGIELNPNLPVRQIMAPVIGSGPDLSGGLITVQAGKREGVQIGNVVTVRGVHLVGRIRKVDNRTSAVMPITYQAGSKVSEYIRGVIMLADEKVGPVCELAATGKGTLVGAIADEPDAVSGRRAEITPGMTVRLVEESWPQSSRMLVIGVVERVEPLPQQPLRRMVTVRPVYDIERWSEVMIRIPTTDEQPGVPASGSPPGAGGGRP